MNSRFIADPEAAVRAVFAAPVELSHQEVAQLCGFGATTVRQIRLGNKWAELLPGIPRFETMNRSCLGCLHFQQRRILATATEPERSGICGLGIPEAIDVRFGRGCGAFAEVRA